MKILSCAGGAVLCLVLAVHIETRLNLLEHGGAERDSRAHPVRVDRSDEDFDWNTVFRVRDYLRGYPAFMKADEAMKTAYAIHVASLRYGIEHELILSVIATESSFRRTAISPKGAVGLMQIMPATGQYLTAELALPWSGTETLHNPEINIACGVHYLKHLHDRFGDWSAALLAYNHGPTRIARRLAEEEDFSPASFRYPEKVLRLNRPSLADVREAHEIQDAY